MTLSQVWGILKAVTAPPSPAVQRIKRLWADADAARELLDLALPRTEGGGRAATKA